MIISGELQQYIEKHASVPDRGVPKAVVVAIASVIGGAGIQAAWPSWYTTGATTTWTCWVVTQRALGYVRVEYGKALYDQHAERERQLVPSSQSAWVRPLADVLGLRWGAVYESQRNDNAYEPAEPITVTFTDRETTIPEDGDVLGGDRPALDRVLTALREGANF